MAGRPREFRHHDVVRALRAAHAAGVANPTVRIRVPSGTEYFVGGEVTAPKKHTTAAVVRPLPPALRAARGDHGVISHDTAKADEEVRVRPGLIRQRRCDQDV